MMYFKYPPPTRLAVFVDGFQVVREVAEDRGYNATRADDERGETPVQTAQKVRSATLTPFSNPTERSTVTARPQRTRKTNRGQHSSDQL